jgi:carbamoyl-phosphate synthase large subunit
MTRVLVTGAGGAAGISVIRALRRAEHHVVGADIDPLAAGLALADEQVLLPGADDDGFVPAVVAAVEHHAVGAVITTVTEEMAALERGRSLIAARGAAMWFSPAEAVATCLDKWRFAQAVERAGLPAPATALLDAQDPAPTAPAFPGPWVVKPRFGRGSRDVALVDDPDELRWALRRTPEPIVQSCCRGREFTADALIDHDGTVAGIVPRWRVATKAGISTKGTTFSDPRVEALVRSTVVALGLRGAINLQGFVQGDSPPEDLTRRGGAGAPVQLLEVNPRFSGGLALSLGAGADLVGEYLRGMLGQPVRPDHLRFTDGVTMTRYYEEIFLGAPARP